MVAYRTHVFPRFLAIPLPCNFTATNHGEYPQARVRLRSVSCPREDSGAIATLEAQALVGGAKLAIPMK